MEDSEEEEREEQESEEFNVIPPYLAKDSKIETEAKGSKRGPAGRAGRGAPASLLLLPAPILLWEIWSY